MALENRTPPGAATRYPAGHDYRTCTDADCSRYACQAWKEGWREGNLAGYEDGYERGYEAGIGAYPLTNT